MKNDLLQNPIFHDETKAREWLEKALWPKGPVCSHCHTIGQATPIKTREGWYQCNVSECRKQFTVTVGTLFERSHIPLSKWLSATYLMCCSKKGISAHQLHRMLGITYKSAWFMCHRIREAMKDDGASGPLGGPGKTIETDETYYGPKEYRLKANGRIVGKQGPGGKAKVVTLVERGGRAKSFKVEQANAATVKKILLENALRGSKLMTDESGIYASVGSPWAGHFASHGHVIHSAGEYVKKDDPETHTNTIEGFFSIFKRGMRGVYQHCDEKHLQRYLAEFDFRYSNRMALDVADTERAAKAIKGIVGKRLTYRRIGERRNIQA